MNSKQDAVITGWSAVSPFGIGQKAFAEGMRAGRPAALGSEGGRVVPGFDVREVLGRKGTRSMDRVTGLAVSAVGDLLDTDSGPEAGPEAALVLGTTTGSSQSMMDFTRDSLTAEQPFYVDPARFPNTVMNCAAGQSAIRHRLQGPNATIAGGRAAGLHALNYARRLLAAGRARTVLCGGAEEYSAARARLEAVSGGGILGEGCAVLRLESAADPAATPIARIRSVELGVVLGGDVQRALSSCVRRALEAVEADPADVTVLSRSGDLSAAESAAELRSVAEVFGAEAPVESAPVDLIGDTGAAAAVFQVLGLLVHAAEGVAGLGVVTSVDRTGSVGCAVLAPA